MEKIGPETIDLIADTYGNCPAWMLRLGFTAMAPLHHLLDKHVQLYRSQTRPGYEKTFRLFERWLSDDVPLAGQIFREVAKEIFLGNRLCRNELVVGDRRVDLRAIECPVLNLIGEYDDIVPPAASRPFLGLVGSRDKRDLFFPNGHMGLAVSGGAQAKLWPEVGSWLRAH